MVYRGSFWAVENISVPRKISNKREVSLLKKKKINEGGEGGRVERIMVSIITLQKFVKVWQESPKKP